MDDTDLLMIMISNGLVSIAIGTSTIDYRLLRPPPTIRSGRIIGCTDVSSLWISHSFAPHVGIHNISCRNGGKEKS